MRSTDGGQPTEMEQAQNALDPIIESWESRFDVRWGSVWLEWGSRPTVNVCLVDPTVDDVDRITSEAEAVGWLARVVAVRYATRELADLCDRLSEIAHRRGRGKVSALGPDTKLNKIFVVLAGTDRELVKDLLSAVPTDALVVSIQPGFGAFAVDAEGGEPFGG